MINIVVLEGRFTADPELKHTSNDIPMTRFSIAVARNYSKGNERQTDFFDVVAWRNTAEFVCKYFKKGNLVMVEGQIQTDLFEARDGTKRKSFYIVANNVHFVGTKSDNAGASSVENVDDDGVQSKKSGEGYSNDASFSQEGSEVNDIDDDDLPF